jgi:hypothetical protein
MFNHKYTYAPKTLYKNNKLPKIVELQKKGIFFKRDVHYQKWWNIRCYVWFNQKILPTKSFHTLLCAIGPKSLVVIQIVKKLTHGNNSLTSIEIHHNDAYTICKSIHIFLSLT